MPRFLPIIAALTVAATLGACTPPGEGRQIAVDLEPCRLRGGSGMTSVPAECGRVSVAENPAEPDGRSIDLFVARIKALNPRFPGNAFTVLAGGPGQAATEFYADYAAVFDRIHRYHDIVLVDQRGTGQSNPLDCDYDESETLEFTPEQAAALAARCLAELDADTRFYTTSVAVGDLDRVRDAFAYDRLDLYGVSYGTRVAQHYAKTYPQRVRTVIIDGVVPADMPLGPGIAIDAQQALDEIFARCAADEACGTHFPDIAGVFGRLADSLRAAPLVLTLPSPVNAKLIDVTLDYNTFAGTIRLLSYSPTTVALLPLLLDEAAENGNWEPLASQAQMVLTNIVDMLSEGMHNAIVCTEDVPFFDVGQTERAALTATYLGDLQLQSLEAICGVWPAGIIDDGFHDPLRTDIPVLLLSGTADPVTPPRYAEEVAAQLTNHLHIVAQGHGHGVLTRNCVAELMAEFVDTASLDGLDPACVDQEKPAPFFTSFAGPEP